MERTAETLPQAARSAPDEPRLHGVDGRTRTAKRTRELYHAFLNTIGRETSLAERTLIVDAVALVMESEALAARASRGEPVDADLRVRVQWCPGTCPGSPRLSAAPCSARACGR